MSLIGTKRTTNEVFMAARLVRFFNDQSLHDFHYDLTLEITDFTIKDRVIYIDTIKDGRPYRFILEGKWKVIKEEEKDEE